jgi:hypothetical protein
MTDLAAQQARRANRTFPLRWRRSRFLVRACNEKEDPGVEEAGEQGADVRAGQPIEATESPGDQGGAAGDQRRGDCAAGR